MTEQVRRSSDYIEFFLNDFDKAAVDTLFSLKSPSRWPAIHAVKHLNRSWRIREIDPEMSAFRALTAEEEAATSLFLILMQHRYNGADKLKKRNHIHKNAVIPFVGAVSRIFARYRESFPPVNLSLDTNQKPARLTLQLTYRNPLTGENMLASPEPPLHFFLSEYGIDKEVNNKLYDFAAEVKQMATEANAKTIIDYLHNRANFRNKLLYAAANGIPAVKGDINDQLLRLRRNVMTILRIYLMVEPYNEHQGFVQQCLDSFLGMLNLVPRDVGFK